jgi:hypothetical protein
LARKVCQALMRLTSRCPRTGWFSKNRSIVTRSARDSGARLGVALAEVLAEVLATLLAVDGCSDCFLSPARERLPRERR